MATEYMVKLGDYYLTRRSIVIEQEDENLNLTDDARDDEEGCTTDGNGTCVSAIRSKELILTLRFLGNRDIKAADSMYRALNTVLSGICKATPLVYQRRVCNEPIQEETIVRGYMRRIDMEREFHGVKSGELHLITRDLTEGPETLVLSMTWLPPSITA